MSLIAADGLTAKRRAAARIELLWIVVSLAAIAEAALQLRLQLGERDVNTLRRSTGAPNLGRWAQA